MTPIQETAESREEREAKAAKGEETTTAIGVLTKRWSGELVTFDQSRFDSRIASLRLGGGMLHIAERTLHVRNLEVLLQNGTTFHCAYRSTDGGKHWEFLSFIPIAFSRHSAFLRMSDHPSALHERRARVDEPNHISLPRQQVGEGGKGPLRHAHQLPREPLLHDPCRRVCPQAQLRLHRPGLEEELAAVLSPPAGA